MRTLLFGIVLIIVLGVGGLIYRNVAEQAGKPVACPVDAKVCPDGTSVAREGLSCTFPTCPAPNTTIDELGIAFAVPAGFTQMEAGGAQYVREYASAAQSSTTQANYIAVSRYPLTASTSALAVIQQTAIGGASGAPVSASSYTATNIAGRQYTVVEIERFEGTVDTAYYLVRSDRGDVLRFDAIDNGADWTNPSLNVSALPAHAALIKLLGTLQGQ